MTFKSRLKKVERKISADHADTSQDVTWYDLITGRVILTDDHWQQIIHRDDTLKGHPPYEHEEPTTES